MTHRRLFATALIAALLPTGAHAQEQATIPVTVDAPTTVLGGVPFSLTVEADDALAGTPWGLRNNRGEEIDSGFLDAGETTIEEIRVESVEDLPLVLSGPGFSEALRPRLLPGWLSLVPPLLAIALALIFREVVVSLFAGIWLGALLIAGFNPISATTSALDEFVLGSLANDPDRVSIAMFSLLLGGMVGIITRNGGTEGIVEALRPYATSQRRGQVMVWLAGLVVFFDDYANTLIVGNTMRPVTDRLKISREKLAYIVDSTAAPLASIAAISTWVGFEISLIGSSLESAASQVADPALSAELLAAAANPFAVFIETIPFRFYPIFALLLVLLVALMQRDFGAMHTAEHRAATGGGVMRPGSTPVADPTAVVEAGSDVTHRWYNAIIPVLTVVVVALAGIYVTGAGSVEGNAAIWDIVGAGDPFRSLLWASWAGCVVGILMSVAQRSLGIGEAIEAWLGGMRAMLLAIVILVLAWGLGGITEALGTGSYLADLLGGALPPGMLPVLVFLIAAAMSFATGTSWGTMAILFPVVVPLGVAIAAGSGLSPDETYHILLGAISSIMAGAIFGDHCSPISDTTVLSSMASSCDHIDHVRTQLPYAALAAVIGMAVGDIPTAYGMSPAISLVIGAVLLFLAVKFLGRPTLEDEGAVELVQAR